MMNNTRIDDNGSALWWVLGLAALLILTGMGLRDPWPADEPRFAQVAREMVHSGQWMFPMRGAELYSDKPPIFMWSIALLYWLTDNMRVAFLLPSALCSLLTIGLVHDIARRLWNSNIALYASLLLLASLQFVLQAKTAQIDAMVACWITVACYGLLRHLITGKAWFWYFLSWFAMGLGVITKGVGFLPLFMFIPWLLLLLAGGRDRLNAPSLSLLAGIPFFILAIALWLVPMSIAVALADDPALTAYRNDILFRQTGTRYANSWAHVKPVYYYVVSVIPVFWLPGILLLPGLLGPWWVAFRRRDPRIVMPLVWILLVIVFFSASPGKRGVYLLPLMPMFCLVVAPYLPDLLQKRWVAITVRTLLGLLAALFMGIAVAAYFGNSRLLEAQIEHGFSPWNMLLAIGIAALVAAVVCTRERVGKSWFLFVVPFWLLYSTWGYLLVNTDRTPLKVTRAVEAMTNEQSKIALVDFREQYLLFLQRPITHFGFSTPIPAQLAEAWRWLGEGDNRYVLLSDNLSLDCFDSSKAESIGRAHGRDWRLYSATARQANCAPPQAPVTRFNYVQPGALR